MSVGNWILPCVVVLIITTGFIRNVNVFSCFIDGAKKGFDTFLSLLPALTCLILATSMLQSSGGQEILIKLLTPIASVFGIPSEVIPLCILSPISGSGSISVFSDILKKVGTDSYAGRVASVIAGASETTFYAVTVYFGSTGIKKTGTVIPSALLGDIVGYICACMTVRFFM